MKEYMRVYANVDLDAVLFNMESMHQNIAKGTKMIAVIKTNGYGHGAVEIAEELEQVDYVHGYAVATIEEAIELREHKIKKPILILGYTFPDCYETLISNDICPTVFSLKMAQDLSKCAQKLDKQVAVHIKIDTGMSRIGFQVTEESADIIAQIFQLPNLSADGIFTHFARADEVSKEYALAQYDRFEKMIRLCEQRGITFGYRHCSNSAGILELPQVNMDLVRAGITVYGLWPSEEMNRSFPLRPVLSLHSHVVHVKTLEAGRAISYGGTYVTNRPTVVATIPVGYGDGYPRGLSNKGYVLIHGQKAPILGRVCMDQFMVDVTEITDVQVGTEVTLLGTDEGTTISMEELGELSGRFNYEFACDLGNRIPRIYYRDHKIKSIRDYFQS